MSNTYDLRGKSAIVTGGAKSIGRAVAELLVANGPQRHGLGCGTSQCAGSFERGR